MCRIKLMQRCSLWMVLRFLLSAVREPKQRWQFLATKCQVNRFICSLFQISWSSANIENDQCISSLEYFTDDIKPIIDLILKWSQQRDVFIIFSPKSSYVLSWMNAGHRSKDEFPHEGAAQEINQVSRFSWIVWSTINSLNGIFSGFLFYF